MGPLSQLALNIAVNLHYIAVVRKGDRLRLAIGALDGEAAGVGLHEGVRVHVAGALEGEEVDAVVAHRSPHRADAWATLATVATPSPARVAPACRAYGHCGGCPLEHMQYATQLDWKTAEVRRILAGVPSLSSVPVAECVASPRPLGYRNKSKLVYSHDGQGRPILGAFAPRSHEVVDLSGCQVAEPPLDDVASLVRDRCAALSIAPYDERTATGLLRYVILRVSHAGAVLVTLVTAAREFADGEALAQGLMQARPDIVGVVQNVNPSRGNALYGTTDVPLAGRDTLEERVGGVHLRLSATAFFQVNRDIAARIYGDVLAAAALTGTERVVDAYSGVGGIALTLAPRAGEVIGIESHPGAVADAQASAQLNHAGRVRFLVGDTATMLRDLDGADVVVLNPPRRGCAPEVLAQAARLSPRLIAYVSCAPDTLARDLVLLDGYGYRAESVTPYDMLPQTPHVEALALVRPPGSAPAAPAAG
jgi:23S rRNA (uracil1939-C5)-methyltransferase